MGASAKTILAEIRFISRGKLPVAETVTGLTIASLVFILLGISPETHFALPASSTWIQTALFSAVQGSASYFFLLKASGLGLFMALLASRMISTSIRWPIAVCAVSLLGLSVQIFASIHSAWDLGMFGQLALVLALSGAPRNSFGIPFYLKLAVAVLLGCLARGDARIAPLILLIQLTGQGSRNIRQFAALAALFLVSFLIPEAVFTNRFNIDVCFIPLLRDFMSPTPVPIFTALGLWPVLPAGLYCLYRVHQNDCKIIRPETRFELTWFLGALLILGFTPWEQTVNESLRLGFVTLVPAALLLARIWNWMYESAGRASWILALLVALTAIQLGVQKERLETYLKNVPAETTHR